VRHAATRATRSAAFPLDESLEDGAHAAAAALARALPGRCAVLSSPALRCRQTALAAGLDPVLVTALAECDFGCWAGITLEEAAAADPDAVERWLSDPEAAPHDGESLRAFSARVALWLDEQAVQDGAAVAFTHAGVVRAAVVHALGAPVHAFWRIDAAPLSMTELHAHDGRWTITRLNHRLAEAA